MSVCVCARARACVQDVGKVVAFNDCQTKTGKVDLA